MFKKPLLKFKKNNKGSLNLEMGLIIALLILTAVTSLNVLSSGIGDKFIEAADFLTAAGESGGTDVIAPVNMATVAESPSGTSAFLDWADVEGATGYQVRYSIDPLFGSSSIVNITESQATLSPLNNGTTYYYQIMPVGGTWGDIENFETLVSGSESFTTAGSGTWTAPGNGTVTVMAWGGGGHGSIDYMSGLGGGGGAFAQINSYPVSNGSNYTYFVGAAGQDSYFVNSSTLLAKAGRHWDDSTDFYTKRGWGGQASECVGDVKHSGGNGGTPNSDNGAGGGGSAGSGGAGGNGGADGTAGTAGIGIYPGATGGIGMIFGGSSAIIPQGNGTSPGAGGGGTDWNDLYNVTVNGAAGAGVPGKIIIIFNPS